MCIVVSAWTLISYWLIHIYGSFWNLVRFHLLWCSIFLKDGVFLSNILGVESRDFVLLFGWWLVFFGLFLEKLLVVLSDWGGSFLLVCYISLWFGRFRMFWTCFRLIIWFNGILRYIELEPTCWWLQLLRLLWWNWLLVIIIFRLFCLLFCSYRLFFIVFWFVLIHLIDVNVGLWRCIEFAFRWTFLYRPYDGFVLRSLRLFLTPHTWRGSQPSFLFHFDYIKFTLDGWLCWWEVVGVVLVLLSSVNLLLESSWVGIVLVATSAAEESLLLLLFFRTRCSIIDFIRVTLWRPDTTWSLFLPILFLFFIFFIYSWFLQLSFQHLFES